MNEKRGHGEKKSRKEDIAVLALLTEPTIGQAAEKTGISESTLWRWMQSDSFKEKYQESKRQAVTRATSRLRQSMTIAVDTLVEVCENKKAPAIARVMAAKAILDSAMKAHETEDLQERIENLEQQTQEQGENNQWAY